VNKTAPRVTQLVKYILFHSYSHTTAAHSYAITNKSCIIEYASLFNKLA